MQNWPDELERQWREFVLLEKIVQVLLQHLEHQARVVLVLKALESPHKIKFVGIFLAQSRQNGHLNLALSRIGRMILQDFDGHNVVGSSFPAFHYLSECATTKKLQHL